MSYPRILLLLPISAFLATVSHGSASNGLEEKLEFTVEEGEKERTLESSSENVFLSRPKKALRMQTGILCFAD